MILMSYVAQLHENKVTNFEQNSYIRKKVRGSQTCSKIKLRFLLVFVFAFFQDL